MTPSPPDTVPLCKTRSLGSCPTYRSNSDSIKAQPENRRDASTSVRAFNREDRYVEGSKRLRNRRQTKIDLINVSTYKAAPGRAGQQRVRKKDLTRGGLGDRELRGNIMDRYLYFEGNKLLRFYTRKERREQHRQ